MRSLLTIAKRDLSAFLLSPLFFAIAGVCSVVWSFTYIKKTIDFAYRSTSPKMIGQELPTYFDAVIVGHISTVNLILLFAIPAITMKLLAEEKKTRTIDLLLTSPLTATELIMGKFIAGFLLTAGLIALAFLYPLFSMLFAEIDLGLIAGSFLGLLFLGASYVAIGLFASSLSSSIIFSFIFAIVLNLFLWLLSQGTLYSDNGVLLATMDHISIGENLFAMVKGQLSLSSLVYFISLMSLFLFMSQKSIDSKRWR